MAPASDISVALFHPGLTVLSGKMGSGFSNGHALVIGIAKYQHFSPLPDAVANDASDFADLLRDSNYCGYPGDQVQLLLNGDATKQAIVRGLKTLGQKARPTDTVIVFFSGHGVRSEAGSKIQSYLIPVDGDLERLRPSALHSDELTSLLRDIGARRLAVFLDACHAGGAGDVKKALSGGILKLGLDDNTYQRLASGAGRVIVASSLVTEVSWVRHGMRNSVFTHCLLDALRGGSHIRSDGLIHIMDVFNDLTEKVPAVEPRQHPILRAHDVENNFPLALYRGGKGRAAVGARTLNHNDTVPEDSWRKAEELAVRLYPQGPTEAAIWSRAGGDLSRLSLGTTGAAAWHDALIKLRRGGGGDSISLRSLFGAMRSDFPNNDILRDLTDVQTSKSPQATEIIRTFLTIPTSTARYAIRFTKLVPGGSTILASHPPLMISEMPLTHQDLFVAGHSQYQSRKRTVALLDRFNSDEVLKQLRQANLRVRLPTYVEWQFAMAANGDAPHTPQDTVPSDTEPALDHWVPNEWAIGRPPASICEWIADVSGRAAHSTAPVALLRVRGGTVSFASATRPAQSRFPMRLVLESEQ